MEVDEGGVEETGGDEDMGRQDGVGTSGAGCVRSSEMGWSRLAWGVAGRNGMRVAGSGVVWTEMGGRGQT